MARRSSKAQAQNLATHLAIGAVVRCAAHLDWGSGVVFGHSEPDAAEVFFPSVGRQVFAAAAAQLWIVRGEGTTPPLLALIQACSPRAWRAAHHHVYVVELAPTVRQVAAFRAANSDATSEGRCLYVGMTGLTPEQRLENHWNGVKAARLTRRFGLRLVPELYERFNPMPFRLAQVMEPELAQRLRQRGHAVWQH